MDPLTYRAAGVDIQAGDLAVRRIAPLAASTRRPEVLGGLGAFAAFCRVPAGYREPVLVSSTDGVGTKLKIAIMADRHDTVGLDLVAMGVNDLLVHGAEPLFFLDYLAVHRVDPDRIETIVAGIAEGCRQAGCALVGGETAEMGALYAPGDYDLAGFAVGVAEQSLIITGDDVAIGARLPPSAWPVPPIFAAIQRAASVDDAEMRRTFNMGLGFLLVVAADDVAAATQRLETAGERVFTVGEIVAGEPGVEYA